MKDLPNDVESLKALVRQLLEKITQLETENAELRRRLGMDNSNSHKPPSSDGYKKKDHPTGLTKRQERQERRAGGTLRSDGTLAQTILA